MEKDFLDDEGFTSLLKFVEYDWADEEASRKDNLNPKKTGVSINAEGNTHEIEFEKLTSEEFNKISNEIIAHQSGLLSNANIKIADFLNIVISGEKQKTFDFTESDEQKLFEDVEQKGEGDEIKSKVVRKVNAKKEKKAIIQYFEKLESLYTNKLANFFNIRVLTVAPKEKNTIKSLSKILIALQILSIYHGKKFSQINEKDDTLLLEEYYVNFGKITDGADTVKGFLMNVLGKYLLLANGGFKTYDYEILNQKLKTYRIQAFEKALFLCLNNDWRIEAEKSSYYLLLLNLHYALCPMDSISDTYFLHLKAQASIFRNKLKYVSSAFSDNLNEYENVFLPNYLQWYNIFTNKINRKKHLVKDTKELKQGAIIFNSKIGFNRVHRKSNGIKPVLDLLKEGYPKIEDQYLLLNLSYGEKCIIYESPKLL